jgi:hypothetical protein
MPSERVLVGGGTTYDNTQVSATYQPYYKFTTSDNYIWNSDILYNPIPSYALPDGTPRNKNYVNNLFTGILPYQNPYDLSYYKNGLQTGLSFSGIKAYFGFGLPVVLTKYRMYNAFTTSIIGNLYNDVVENDMGNQTPQDWNLAGTNDGVTWTTIDTRTSQAKFPNATSRLAKNCSYSEYTISGAAAYKNYRLIVTKGGRTATACDKSGCVYKAFQIGEIQLLGYESPTTPCELHGGYTLFQTAKYLNGSGTVLTETSGTTHRSSFARAFSNFGFRNCNSASADWAAFPNTSSVLSPFYKYYNASKSAWGPFGWTRTGNTASTGYLDFGVAVTLSSYNITSGISSQPSYQPRNNCLTAWTLYGSNDNSTWTTLDNRSGITSNNAANTYNYTIGSPASYRYYKMDIKGGATTMSDKSGSYYDAAVNSLQFVGYVS